MARRRSATGACPPAHTGSTPEEVQRDQRERLRMAMIELIASNGYQAVRILDLTKLARVSRPTFYSLYADKEELLPRAPTTRSPARAAEAVMCGLRRRGLRGGAPAARASRAFAELAAAEPEAMSLLVLGAFGAGAKALERRSRTFAAHRAEHPLTAQRASAEAGGSQTPASRTTSPPTWP